MTKDETQIRVRKPVGAVLSVRVPRELAVAADEFAREHSQTMSELVRIAVEQYLTFPAREHVSLYASTYEAGLILSSPAAGIVKPLAGRAHTETREYVEA